MPVFRISGNPVDDLSKFGAVHILNEDYICTAASSPSEKRGQGLPPGNQW